MTSTNILSNADYSLDEKALNTAYRKARDTQHQRLELLVKSSTIQMPGRLDVGIIEPACSFRLYVNNKVCVGLGLGNPWTGGGVFGGTLFINVDSFDTLVAKTKSFHGHVEFVASAGMTLFDENSKPLAYFHGGGISDILLLNAGGGATWESAA